MFAFFFSSPRIQTGCFLTPGEPLPNSTVTGLKTSNLLWVFYFQLCVVYYGGFKQNGKNFLSPDCLAYIVGILLIFYLLMAPHCLVTLCEGLFMDISQLIFAGSSALFSVGFSLSWATRGDRGNTEELPTGTGGSIPGKSYSRFLPSWLFYTLQLGWFIHTVFLFSILGLNSTPQAASALGTRQKLTWAFWILGKSMISGLPEGVLLLKTTSWILSLFSQL